MESQRFRHNWATNTHLYFNTWCLLRPSLPFFRVWKNELHLFIVSLILNPHFLALWHSLCPTFVEEMEILKVINLPVHEYINSLYSSCFSMKFYYFHKIVHAYVIMLQKQENTYNIKTWSFPFYFLRKSPHGLDSIADIYSWHALISFYCGKIH